MTGDEFMYYMKAQADTRTALERLNFASAALENAQIRERLAKIKSQSDPLASLIGQEMKERDRLYAAAFYVVNGRMPT